MMEISGLLTVACLFLFCVPSCGLNVHCFYTNWAQYRTGAGRFTVSNINASLCTHIFYGFAVLEGNNIVKFESNDYDMWKQLNDLKQANPRLKTFLSVGGFNLGREPFAKMVSSQDNRTAFVNSAVSLLRNYSFDGLDIDWEYPLAIDKENFKILSQEIASVFEMEGKNTNRPRLQLTLSVPAGINTIDIGYDINGMNSYVDYWNVMGYDYHGSWEKSTNLPTPLKDQGDRLSVSSTVDHYLALGASSEKLILGVAFYARTWAISEYNSSIGSPATGAGPAGAYTRTAGVLSYYEVCNLIHNPNFPVQYENTYGYLNYGATHVIWFSYEAQNSLEEKMKFIERKSLGGAMIWTLDFDDFSGIFCGQDKYPLTSLVSSRMLSISTTVSTNTAATAASNTTSASSTTTNTTPGSAAPTFTSTSNVSSAGNSTICSAKYGIFPDNGDCSYYVVCENGTVTRRIKCVPNTIFNPNTTKCENLANTTYTCPNQTSAITTTATTTSTTAATTTASTTAATCTTATTTTTTISSTTAPTSTASTTATTTTASTTAPTSTASTTATTTTASTTAATSTASTTAPTTTASTTATTTTASTTATTTTASTTAPSSTASATLIPTSTAVVTPRSQNTTKKCDFICPSKIGIFANKDCTIYNVCYYWKATCIRCPSGQIYNPEKTKCESVSETTYTCPS